jgi:cation diffusion facilitator CzcD-associated flavoprotein CzcO
MSEHFDIVIVGAGLSGIGAGYHLQTRCPGRSYVILENRERIGGTWDLFRYPGIRSDSDMYTLGYAFRTWKGEHAIADGASIRSYVQETAREHGVDRRVRFRHRVVEASWSSATSRWTVVALRGAEQERVEHTCSFLFMCSGYYRYESGYSPAFPGSERFQGRVVHPQHWPEDLDYAGKRVVVIGSGATAVTLVPSMANGGAAHVTMLQRSPTYIVSQPARDGLALALRRVLPEGLAYGLVRWKRILLGAWFFWLSRRAPRMVARRLRELIQLELGADYDPKHFTPRYDPWDQRVCLIPDGDLLVAIKERRAAIVTDRIATFTEHGVRLESGAELPADIIVTATGLELVALGDVALRVDGAPFEPGKTMAYRSMMFRDVPNLASAFGYTNASWTLKADLTSAYVCRLLNYMHARGYRQCTPRLRDASVTEAPWLDFSSGYVQRARDVLPKQGDKAPWKLYQNYPLDLLALRLSPIDDGVLEFRS